MGTLELNLTVAQAGETLANVVAGALVLIGAMRMHAGRTLDAYRWFDRALLVAILVGQVFAYIDRSFVATWAFLVCVALLVSVRFMGREELALTEEGTRSSRTRSAPPAPVH